MRHRSHPHDQTIRLADGTRLSLRPLRRSDRALIADGFARLSETSRYTRFFTLVPELAPSMLTYLTEIDHRDHEALVAIDPADGRLAGVARCVRLPSADGGTAEVAVTVVDAWQGRGLGRTLLRALAQRARALGVRRLLAIVKADNLPAVRLFTALGPSTVARAGAELEITIDIGAIPGRRQRPRGRRRGDRPPERPHRSASAPRSAPGG